MASHNESSSRGFKGYFEWFVHSEVTGSILLLACTIIALTVANSPWSEGYENLLHTYAGLSWGDAAFKLSLHHWINDGLMVIFFFVVGLEIKRELVVGQLSSVEKAILPVAAALGGMVVPAALYAALNAGKAGAAGWGIPMATDIAFALGVLAMFGKRVPIGLKVFLTALAIADDLGAVAVIALFYTDEIDFTALTVGGMMLVVLFIAVQNRFSRIGGIALLIVGVWVAVFASGVHATVAGILVALVVPVRARICPERFMTTARQRLDELEEMEISQESMIDEPEQLNAIEGLHQAAGEMVPTGLALEHYLHPVQAFLILPMFALANAGVPLDLSPMEALANPITLGVILGLVVGKPLGVTLFSWLAVRTGRCSLPDGVTWSQILGAGFLAGIGFTMSLFVSELAFTAPESVRGAKIGILEASLAAGIIGYVILRQALPRAPGR